MRVVTPGIAWLVRREREQASAGPVKRWAIAEARRRIENLSSSDNSSCAHGTAAHSFGNRECEGNERTASWREARAALHCGKRRWRPRRSREELQADSRPGPKPGPEKEWRRRCPRWSRWGRRGNPKRRSSSPYNNAIAPRERCPLGGGPESRQTVFCRAFCRDSPFELRNQIIIHRQGGFAIWGRLGGEGLK